MTADELFDALVCLEKRRHQQVMGLVRLLEVDMQPEPWQQDAGGPEIDQST